MLQYILKITRDKIIMMKNNIQTKYAFKGSVLLQH